MKFLGILGFVFITGFFSNVNVSEAQSSDECLPNAPISTTQTQPNLDSDLVRNMWRLSGGFLTSYIQEELKTVELGKISKLVGFHLYAAGLPLEIGLTLRDIKDGKYELELRDVTTGDIITSKIITDIAVDVIAGEIVAWSLTALVAAYPAMATLAVVAGTTAVVMVLEELNITETIEKGLAYSIAGTRQLFKIGIEEAQTFAGTAETWIYDLVSEDKMLISKNDDQTKQVKAFVGGQCITFESRIAVEQIAKALGISEKNFLDTNGHLAYQSGADNLVYLDYLANKDLKATLPDGNSMDVGELILRVQLGAFEPITCDGAPRSRLVVDQQGRVTLGKANNLRDKPTKNGSQVIGQMPELNTFSVLEGPVCANDLAWWKVNFNGLVGWTAEGQNDEYWVEPLIENTSTDIRKDIIGTWEADIGGAIEYYTFYSDGKLESGFYKTWFTGTYTFVADNRILISGTGCDFGGCYPINDENEVAIDGNTISIHNLSIDDYDILERVN